MDIEHGAKVMKALANPNRLELFLEIAVAGEESSYPAGCECVIAGIAKRMKIGAPTVSHHLKELANANLITTERRGKFLVARINGDTVGAVLGMLGKTLGESHGPV